ncbi:hypothetical protein Tco_0247062 [Tanacetum coccineum]
MLLADVALPLDGALYSRSGLLWATSGSSRVLDLGSLLIVWSGLAARIILYVIMSLQSSVSSVRAEDITRLRSAYLLMFRDLACFRAMLLGRCMNRHGCSFLPISTVRWERELDLCCRTFNIPGDLRPELPGRDDTIKKAPYYQINFSQLFVLGAAKDPLPSGDRVNTELRNLLDHHRTVIRRYLETFLCLVGLSRSFDDHHVRPTLLKDDENMGLLDYVKSADPFKVKTGERTLAEADGVVISEPVPTNGGKSLAALRRLELHSGPQDAAVQMHRTFTRFVVSSNSGHDDAGASPGAEPHVRVENIAADSTVDTAAAENVYVPEWNVTNGARVDSSSLCRNLLDHVTPLALAVSYIIQFLCIGSLGHFNINSAQHVCMVSKLRLWYEHEIISWDKFQKKFTDSSAAVQQRDAEIGVLKAKLEKAESEDAEVGVLCGRVSELEIEAVAMSEEVDTLNKHNAELLGKVSARESEREELSGQVIRLGADCESLRSEVAGEAKLREEFKSFQDAKARRFEENSAQLDARIADVRRYMDNDLYPHMFTAIAGWRWVLGHGIHLVVTKCAQSAECRSALRKVISFAIDKGIQEGLEAGIEHGRSGRSLAQVEAYDPEVKNKYVPAVTDFENVSFALLDEFESLKDSPLASIMFQPSVDQVTILIYSDAGSIIREMPLSEVIPAVCVVALRIGLCPPPAPLQDLSLGVADYQVSTLTLTTDEVPTTPPAATQTHDDLFDATVLDKPTDA